MFCNDFSRAIPKKKYGSYTRVALLPIYGNFILLFLPNSTVFIKILIKAKDCNIIHGDTSIPIIKDYCRSEALNCMKDEENDYFKTIKFRFLSFLVKQEDVAFQTLECSIRLIFLIVYKDFSLFQSSCWRDKFCDISQIF